MASALLKNAAAVLTGFAVYLAVFGQGYVKAVSMKVKGAAPECPWSNLISMPVDAERFRVTRENVEKQLKVTEIDEAKDIYRIESPGRPFWIRRKGEDMDGKSLLAYLLAEQQWVAESDPPVKVRQGDWVIDVGGHVGVFTSHALKLGAEKVFIVEPDPVNVECIRRNFAAEIAAGRVTVIPEGAWSKASTIELNLSVANSGTGSMMYKEQGAQTILVPVRPIDDMVAEHRMPRVDFIKMDIEGAEREALKGAAETLKRWRPRLALDSYHLPDDAVVLPKAIAAANPAYVFECGPCELNTNQGERISPHVAFYR
jgi:FkbM family methyltransferase